MSGTPRQLVVVSGGGVGRDPFDVRSWSGTSHCLMFELQQRRLLSSVVTVKPARVPYAAALLRTVRGTQGTWHTRLYRDVGYRRALTAAARRGLARVGPGHPVLQLGGYYDVASIAGARDCYGYYDGTIGARASDPQPMTDLTARQVHRLTEYEAAACRGMRMVFTMSEHLRASMIRDYGVDPDRVTAVGAGINEDELPALDPKKDYGSQELLFIGRDFRRKGGQELLEAFSSVKRHVPGALLHIVGPVDPPVPPGLADGVVVHGAVDKSTGALSALMRRASILVMPSRYEPFGIAPLEAMAHGVPAVVTGEWALKECVEPGVTGAWVPPRDPGTLAQVLMDLLADPLRLAAMGRSAHASVAERFTWSAVVSRMASLMSLEPGSISSPS